MVVGPLNAGTDRAHLNYSFKKSDTYISTPSGYLIKCYASLVEKEKGGTVPKTTTLGARVTTWYCTIFEPGHKSHLFYA